MTDKRKSKRGRPKGARNHRTIVREVAMQQVTIKGDGGAKTVKIGEAMLLLLERRTMSGDVAADKALTRLRNQIIPQADDDECGFLLAPEPLGEEEWIRQQEILNSFREKPDEGGGLAGGGKGPGDGGETAPSGAPQPNPSTPSSGSGAMLPTSQPSHPPSGPSSNGPPKPSMRGRIFR